ncbi:glycosyltransferase family 4 protein [Microbacterium esteraromaticum]|uniref:glycosyltransferase family 4 protein n=1 Tax=Microbacterium esteraromaticum TaxID=57043 RepID=UPI001CD1BED6|nr:glycosyltransferase family 4 protein [Microbacterium esteraromaticum]MCA1305479.1 glycosyltransferase family 4 protein [Microbacterium esteraromaticum]
MGLSRSASPHIVHLAHTTAAGGAELALKRLLDTKPDWEPSLLIPAEEEENVFVGVSTSTGGVRQLSGASRSGALRALGLGTRLLVQAGITRWHPAVRHSDLVVANSTRSAAYGALAVLGTRRPFVVHLRDHISPEALGAVGYRIMTRLVLPRANGVVANSRGTLDTARGFLHDDAVVAVIPSPSGLGRLQRHSRGDGPLRIGMLARLDPWKGQLALLDAFAQAFPDGDEQLDLAGAALFEHAEFADELRVHAEELGIADRVNLLGHVHDIAPLLATWDVAVQYSLRAEPMGQNVLQCLAAGTAVVVADEGGPTEWVRHEHNGLRAAPRDTGALADALRRLADDPALRQRLSATAVRTPGLLGDAEIAAIHAGVYRDVITLAAADRHAATGRAARSTAPSMRTVGASLAALQVPDAQPAVARTP